MDLQSIVTTPLVLSFKDKVLLGIAFILVFVIPLSLFFFSPLFVFFAGLGIASIVLSLWKLELGVLILAIYTPLEPFFLKFVPDNIYPFLKYSGEFFLLFIFIYVFAKLLLTKKFRYQKSPIDVFFILFIIISFISIVYNSVPLYVGFLGWRQIFRYLLLYYVAVYSSLSQKQVKRLLGVILILVFFEALLGIVQAIVGEPLDSLLLPDEDIRVAGVSIASQIEKYWESGQRIYATLGRYDRFGTFLCFFILLAFGLFYEIKSTINRNKLIVLMIVSLIALILSYSRMSWFGLLIGLISIGIFIKKDWRIFAGGILSAILLFTYLSLNTLAVEALVDRASMTLAERFFEVFSRQSISISYGSLGRLFFIEKTFTVVLPSSPFLGVGLGQYGSGVASFLNNTQIYDRLGIPFGVGGVIGSIDNNWLSLLGETGILGIFFFGGIIFALLVYTLSTYQKTKDQFIKGLSLGYFGATLAVCFQAFLGPFFEIRTLSLYLWLFGGILIGLRQQEISKKISQGELIE